MSQNGLFSSGTKYTRETLLKTVSDIGIIPRMNKIERITWLQQSVSKFGKPLLYRHYGLFLSLLRKTVPIKPMVDFLIEITDNCVITQARVSICCDLFTMHGNSPSIARLLAVMRERCNSNIYVPPLGAKRPSQALIPLDIVTLLSQDKLMEKEPETFNLTASKISITIYQQLNMLNSDIALAETLAELVPLTQMSGRVLAGIEAWVDEYLNHTWPRKYKNESTATLEVISSCYFRFWNLDRQHHLEQRLLEPMMYAHPSAARIIIPHLWHLGAAAKPLMQELTRVIRPLPSKWRSHHLEGVYMQIYQYYRWITLLDTSLSICAPPPHIMTDMVIRLKLYLLPCSLWAHELPDICETLQGSFSLASNGTTMETLQAVLSQNTALLYGIANNAWLGDIPQFTFNKMKSQLELENGRAASVPNNSVRSPVIRLSPQTLEETLGVTYNQFCSKLVHVLNQANLPIVNYLLPR